MVFDWLILLAIGVACALAIEPCLRPFMWCGR